MKLISGYGDLSKYQTYRASLHNHTFKNGIPTASPKVALSIYLLCKIQIVAITDHDRRLEPYCKHPSDKVPWRAQDWHHSYPDSLLLPGFEATFPQNHVNVLGLLPQEIPIKPGERGFIAAVQQRDGFTVLNHPGKWNHAPQHVLEDPELSRCMAMEVYNGGQAASNPARAQASLLWDYLLSAGLKIFGLANSDCHDYDFTKTSRPNSAWNVFWLEELSWQGVLVALKAGRFYATTGIELQDLVIDKKSIFIKAQGAEKISFFGHRGKLLAEVYDSVAEYVVRGDEKYIRAEVEGSSSKAWIQPVWVE